MAHEPSGTDGQQQSAPYDHGQYGEYQGYWEQPTGGDAAPAPDYSAAYGSEYAYGQYPDADPSGTGYPAATDGYGYQQQGYDQQFAQDYGPQQPYGGPGDGTAGYDAAGHPGYQEPSGYEAPSYASSASYQEYAPQQYAGQEYPPQDYGAQNYGTQSYGTQGYAPQGYPAAQDYPPQDGPQTDLQDGYPDPAAWQTQAEWQTREDAGPRAEDGPTGAGTPGRGSPPARESAPDEAGPDGDPAPPDAPRLKRMLSEATGRLAGADRRTLLIRAGAGGGVLLAVLVGAGFLLTGGGSGGHPSAGGAAATAQVDLGSSHSKAWSAAAPAATGAGGSSAPSDGLLGSWLTGKAVVRGDGTGITAYALSGGGKLWTLAPPTAGAVPCAMSPDVNADGIGAVLFQPKPGSNQPCTSLVAVDTATGQAKWQATISKTTSAYSATVGVTGTRVVVVGDKQAVGYDPATGKQNWTYSGPGKFCSLSGDAGTSNVVVQATCADTSPKQQAVQLDAADGRLAWWRGLPDTASSFTVLSASPVVIAANQAAGGGSIISFSATGTSQPAIQVGRSGGSLATSQGAFSAAPSVFFQGSTMVTTLTPATAAPGAGTTVVGYDLATGAQLWRTVLQEKGQAQVVAIDGTAAVVATEERAGQPARLDRIGLTDGKETQGGGFPSGTGSLLTAGRVRFNASLVVALPSFTSTYNTPAVAFRTAAG